MSKDKLDESYGRALLSSLPSYQREFVQDYLAAALWASHDDHGKPLDAKYSIEDFSGEAIERAVSESVEFMENNREDLEKAGRGDYGQHGHDFFLTRNGHGAGFWDRGYGAAGDRLTKATKPYREIHPEVGDDGNIHWFG